MSCYVDNGFHQEVAELTAPSEAMRGVELKYAAKKLENGHFQSDFIISDMHCAACIKRLETGLKNVPGIEYIRANLSVKRVSVIWREDEISALQIEHEIGALGFSCDPFDLVALAKDDKKTGRQLLVALGVAGFSAMNIMLLSISVWSGADAETAQLFHLISGLIAVPAVFTAGRPFFNAAWKVLQAGKLNMEVPISLAVLLALGLSIFESLNGGTEAYFDASVTLLFFLLIGRYLDHLMRRRARGAVEQLGNLAGKGGVVVGAKGDLAYLPLDDIRPGMVLRITAGERFPVDACITTGNGDFDRSLVTGESEPVSLGIGSELEAGTLNLTGSVDVEVLRSADQSFLAEIMQLMETAEKGRGRYVRVADRMATIYAPAVHILAAATFIGWMLLTGGDWYSSLYTAIAVLIVTCPCALGLAVPVVHVIAATRLFKAGILMKDGGALERLSEVNTILFDKTGTLTTNSPMVTRTEGTSGNLSIAVALAMRSTHPASQSIAKFLAPQLSSDEKMDVSDFLEVPGCGVEAKIGHEFYRLGRPEWAMDIAATDWTESVKGGVVFASETGGCQQFFLKETICEGAVEAIKELKNQGVNLEILSGDHPGAVEHIARFLGIKRFSARNTPQDKTFRIQALADAGCKSLMVGDGLNDAAALTASDVSMAPANACDVGRMSADFVFTRRNLDAIPFAITIAEKAKSLIRQNFALAFSYNLIAVPLAMIGHVTPLIAALAMSASSILVIANSMRLNLSDGHKFGRFGSRRIGLFPALRCPSVLRNEIIS